MADAQYVIEIASRVQGAAATAAEMDRLASELSNNGIRAGEFEDALAALAPQLEAARAAASAARAAHAASQERYEQLEGAARKAGQAEERAAARAAAAAAKASQAAAAASSAPENERAAKAAARAAAAHQRASAALQRASAAATAARAAVSGYQSTVDDLRGASQAAAAAQERVASTIANVNRVSARVRDNLGDAATNMSTFRGALGDVGGPLGELGERLLYPAQALVDLRERFGTTAAVATVAGVGFTAVAAAIVAVDVAALAAVASVGAFGVKLADANRSARLTFEALARVNPELRSVSSGFAELTDTTGIASTELTTLARSLLDARVSAAELPTALRAAALAEAALGQGGSAQFVADIKAGRQTVSEFADYAQRTFGDLVPAQMLSLGNQSRRLQTNLGRLFDGLDIEPVLFGVQALVRLFDGASGAGRTLKDAVTGVFQPLIDNAQNAAFVVEAFAIGVASGLTKLYMLVKPTINAVAELFGIDTSSFQLEAVLNLAAAAGEAFAPILVALAVGMAVLTVGIGALVVALGGPIVVLAAAAGAFVAFAVTAAAQFALVVSAVYEFVASMYDAGAAVVQGFVNGILAGASAVVSAVTSVFSGALEAGKNVLGIHSPSTEFGWVADMSGEGYVQHMDQQAGEAQRAMRDMVTPSNDVLRAANDNALVPPKVASAGAPAGLPPGLPPSSPAVSGNDAPGGAGGRSIVFENNTFVFNGVTGAEDAEARFEELLTLAVEGDAAAVGAKVA